MIDRILLVAGRELRATLLTRAFVIMVLTPIIAALAVPLVYIPVRMIMSSVKTEQREAATARDVELVDPLGRFAGPLGEALGPSWVVHTVDGETPLTASEYSQRLVLTAEAVTTGRYTLLLEAKTNRNGPARVAPLTTAMNDVLGRARLVEGGLSAADVNTALDVKAKVQHLERPPFDPVAVFAQIRDVALPTGVLFLMFSALSMAGQGLLTSTLEEKSTRVAEVLLGAVSPVELLTGKVLGQLAVSIIFTVCWGGPSLLALALFASYWVGPLQVVYVIGFVAIASLSWAAVMGGIGSAVNDLTEAQHILGPLFMVMMLFFAPAIGAIAAPDAPMIIALSLLPPTGAPTMAARLLTASPAPHWQVWISLLTSGAFAVCLLWMAGRLFRIGLLLRSAPPNLRTLLRWIMRG